MITSSVSLWISAVLILLSGVFAGFFVIRALGRTLRLLKGPLKPPSHLPLEKREQTEFVIETFGDLVQKLKDKEQELRHLRSLAEERATEVERHNQVLLEQMEMKKRLSLLGEMSAGIAHEFRNAMGTILGYTRLLSKEIASDHPSQKYVTGVVEEISALDTMIHDLLHYGKPMSLHLAPVDLGALIQKAVRTTLGDTPAFSGLRINLPSIPVWAAIDEVLFRQVMTNLVRNAVEAMPKTVSQVMSQEESLVVSLERQATSPDWLAIRISDNGVGIPEENLEKIFLPFFTTKVKGTGMGLALVHKIVLAHGGQITVERHAGPGTIFVLHLPELKPPSAEGVDKPLP